MSFQQELRSWFSPPKVETSSPPNIGDQAPSHSSLQLPRQDGKPVVITFLRHCGCPFAEKTFLRLRTTAQAHPAITFLAVSHSTQSHTTQWLHDIGDDTNPSNLQVIVDEPREVYAAWGLGTASWWHVLAPQSLWAVVQLARNEGIANRPTQSGSRWQTSGSWAVDGGGKVVWGGPSRSAEEIAQFEDAVKALK